MSERDRLVSELGESELVRRLLSRLAAPPPGEIWSGDDAAAVAFPHPTQVITTDAIVEGVDFELSYAGGYDVGWKAVAVNASDVAAMGARPVHAVATLSMPGDSTVGLFDDVTEGLVAAATEFGASLVGGDLGEASEVSLSVAMTGRLFGERPVLRSGSSPGDAICVTGSLGGARAGLHALRAGAGPDHPNLVARQLRPRARVREAAELVAAGVTSMIDVSDGLARDLWRLMEAAGTGCEVEPSSIPVTEGAERVAGFGDPTDGAIIGGEDFELLATIPQGSLGAAVEAVGRAGTSLTQIGVVTDGERAIGGRPLDRWKELGWDHLRIR